MLCITRRESNLVIRNFPCSQTCGRQVGSVWEAASEDIPSHKGLPERTLSLRPARWTCLHMFQVSQHPFPFSPNENGGQDRIDFDPRPSPCGMDLHPVCLAALGSNGIHIPSIGFQFRERENGGQDRIRTCEGDASGFTVHSVWPLRNLPIFRHSCHPHLRGECCYRPRPNRWQAVIWNKFSVTKSIGDGR